MSVFGLDISYSLAGESGEAVVDNLSAAFERAGENIANFGEYVFPLLTPVFEAEVAAQFDAQGRGPNRGAWAPLSEKYAAWKATAYPGAPLLVATGALRQALTSGGGHARRATSGDAFDFGTEGLPYASFHQMGTSRMPDRPPFDFGDEFEAALRDAALEGVRDAIAAAGVPGEVTT